jgi:FkbM family methyltransferase
MKFLLVVRQQRNAGTFMPTLRLLVERGHEVVLAIQEVDGDRDRRLETEIASERFAVVAAPIARTDEWAPAAGLLRRLRDAAHYLRPEMRGAIKLQSRMLEKVQQELLPGRMATEFVAAARTIHADAAARVEDVCRLAERSLPTSAVVDEFMAAHRPDVLLLSPLVHFGSAQADLVASARRASIPVYMLLFSWDNLSTKGCLHQPPDLMFVWNERQRREAAELHGFASDRVVVVGAPRFDRFFELTPRMTREQFLEPLGLDPRVATLLYVCSSPLVSAGELTFVRRWLAALRSHPESRLRECNIIVRPHPDIALLPQGAALQRHRWPADAGLAGHLGRPFDGDARAVVLQTGVGAPEGLFESITHSDAVVGLNTTAELEAGIAGKPVFTILAADDADGQASTMHFHYLTAEHGGFVSVATELVSHCDQLAAAIVNPPGPGPIRTFIENFLRPHGIETPVAPLLADALERRGAAPLDTPVAASDALTHDEAPIVPAAAAGVLSITWRGWSVLMRRPDRDDRLPASIDDHDGAWLDEHVALGNVVYDVYAADGACALFAATQRGATVVAFEPAYLAYGNLCENIQLNRCEGTVIPLPVALSDGDALLELKYARGRAGRTQYLVRDRRWRVRPVEGTHAYVQPVITTTIESIGPRFGLPVAQHLRLSVRADAVAVLRGAPALVAPGGAATICCSIDAADERALLDLVAPHGWIEGARQKRSRALRLLLVRAAMATGGRA